MAKKASPVNKTIKTKPSKANGANTEKPAVKASLGRRSNGKQKAAGRPSSRERVQKASAPKSISLEQQLAQREAELAIINSVQAALAAELNIQGIYDAVGDRLREIFNQSDVGIAIYDSKNNLIHIPYTYERGKRLMVDSFALDEQGFIAHVLRTRETLVINENMAQEMEKYGSHVIDGTLMDKSLVYVPLIAGNQARGVISLNNSQHEHAFSDLDVRLLTTITNSMSMALENVRLFDETQRLLKETAQRNAELAIINSVQAALAAELNIQGIYEVVGEKIRDIFGKKDVGIRIYDPLTAMEHFPYTYENGKRIQIDSQLLSDKGFSAHVYHTRQTLVVNENILEEMEKYGSYVLPGTAMPKSQLMVPLVAGDQARGLIEIVDMDREHAFDDSDVRLLQTLANSMSVALENARLFDETQRLLKETEQRNAELAIINSVQAALAAELNIQGIYDAVGDKIREIFHNTDMDIRIYDPRTNLLHFPYVYENGERLEVDPVSLREGGFAPHVLRTRETLVINENALQEMEKYGSYVLPGTQQQEKSMVFVPLVVGDQARGLITLANLEREHAFSDSDVRLLQTLANSMSIALENARLFDETNRDARESVALNEVGRDISSTLDLSAVMERIASHARELLKAETSAIFLPEAGGTVFRAIVAQGVNAEEIKADTIQAGEGIIGTLAQQATAEFINDTSKDPRALLIPGTPTQSEERLMVAPLLTDEKVSGMMAVWREGGETFAQADLEFLEELSLQAAIAIKNANLFDEIEQRAAELAIINSVQEGLASKLNFQTIIELVGDRIRDIFDAQAINITQYDVDQDLFSSLYTLERGIRHSYAPMPPGPIFRRIVDTRESLLFKTLAEMNALNAITVPGTESSKSGIFVPLVQGKQLMGVIALENLDRENAFSEADLRLLTTLANSMSVASRTPGSSMKRNACSKRPSSAMLNLPLSIACNRGWRPSSRCRPSMIW